VYRWAKFSTVSLLILFVWDAAIELSFRTASIFVTLLNVLLSFIAALAIAYYWIWRSSRDDIEKLASVVAVFILTFVSIYFASLLRTYLFPVHVVGIP
jgi:hypothetical protein